MPPDPPTLFTPQWPYQSKIAGSGPEEGGSREGRKGDQEKEEKEEKEKNDKKRIRREGARWRGGRHVENVRLSVITTVICTIIFNADFKQEHHDS